MTDSKLFRCYWELLNGMRYNGMQYHAGDGIFWDSAFPTDAYDKCITNGSQDPMADIKYIESKAKARGIELLGMDELRNCAIRNKPYKRKFKNVKDNLEGLSQIQVSEITSSNERKTIEI